jgi:hypothetical protein
MIIAFHRGAVNARSQKTILRTANNSVMRH